MVVSLARHSGFCFGVRRAIQLALDAAQGGQEIFTLGELIHNPQYVQQMADLGIKVVPSAADIHDSIVVIRSHGITKSELQLLTDNGNTIIDATCPYVSRTHDLVREAVTSGIQVLILGDPKHPEVIGMHSYGDQDTLVVAPGDEIPKLRDNRLCVISQTTQTIENLNDLVSKLLPDLLELRVFNTICLATSQRQQASACLAKNSDLMVVIGGRHSSNTRMLAQLCAQYTETIHVETEAELKAEDFMGRQNIGLAAGASTPEETIVSVYNKIKKINGEPDAVTRISEIPLFKEESC